MGIGKILESVGKAIVPKKIRPHLGKYYRKAGRREPPYKRYGAYFYISAIITLVIYLSLIYPNVRTSTLKLLLGTLFSWIVVQLIIISFFWLCEYIAMDLIIYRRVKNIEKNLADFLDLVAANLKGGMTLEQAIWSSIRPEFGVLGEEMGVVAKKVMVGEDTAKALREFAEKYDSLILKRTFEIFIGELATGGKMSDILDKIVNNLRATKELRDEMVSSTLNYVIFISIIVMFVMPALFALSYQLIKIVTTIAKNVGSLMGGASSMPLSGIRISISPIDLDLFRGFSLIAMTFISIVSSMLISIIQKGEVKGGIKYIPVFLIITLLTYLFFTNMLSSVFGGLGL